jgi:hypothetical protein
MLNGKNGEIRRRVATPAYAEALSCFAKLADRGPPRLRPCLVMAAQQTPFWKRVIGLKAVDGKSYSDLAAACEVVERASSYATSDGLFAGFSSLSGIVLRKRYWEPDKERMRCNRGFGRPRHNRSRYRALALGPEPGPFAAPHFE